MGSQAQKKAPSQTKTNTKQGTPAKFIPIAHFKAYLDKKSNVRVDFSRKPISPGEFTCLYMGVIEAYTELLLRTNSRKEVYTHFNNAFGIFLRKILPEQEIYETSAEHKKLKKMAEDTLMKPDDPYASETNRLAAYILAKEILRDEVGLSDASIDLILNRRLGLIPEDTSNKTAKILKPVNTGTTEVLNAEEAELPETTE